MTETKNFGNLLGNHVRISTSGKNAINGNLAHPTLPEILNRNKIKAVVIGKKQQNQSQKAMTFESLGEMYGTSGNSKKVEINSSFSHLKVKKDNQLS